VDGNKRAATVAALVFLALNGIEIEAEGDEFEQAVLAVAEGNWDKATLASFLRVRASPQAR
jgi:death-on-curing protein